MDKELMNLLEQVAEKLGWVCNDFIKGISSLNDVPRTVRLLCSELCSTTSEIENLLKEKDDG